MFIIADSSLQGKTCLAIPARSVAGPVVDDFVPVSIALRRILAGGIEDGCAAVIGVGEG